jgi:predicted transposase YbfD/YdcC
MNGSQELPMNTCPSHKTLWDAFSSVPDHRSRQGRRYPLPALLTLATAAMLCGRVTLTGIAWWARTLKRSDLAALGIRQARAPCPATWCGFFQSLRVDDLEAALGIWVRGDARTLGHVAIDGKWLCGAHGRGEEPVKLLAAFSIELEVVVASVKVPEGTNEIGIVSELLRRFPLDGATITGDAAFTRAAVALQIVQGGGDYFLTVKDNHRHLRRDLAALFHEASPWRRQPGQAVERAHSRDRGHGPEEIRNIETMPLPERYVAWPGAAQACRITRLRRTPEGDSIETVYALTSIPRGRGGNADYLLDLARAHWSIENRLHLVRDVSMREDACKVRTGDAPQGLAALRNACVTTLRRCELRTSVGAHYFGENKAHSLALCREKPPFCDIRDGSTKILSGQKALVTGANSGIGKAVAIALGEAGPDAARGTEGSNPAPSSGESSTNRSSPSDRGTTRSASSRRGLSTW